MHTKEFLLSLPEKVNASLLDGVNTRFHFDLSGTEGGQITIEVENGVMNTSEGLMGEASCIIKADSEDLKKVFKGELNPMMAILTGKLKISNQGEMLKFAKLLGWM
jgi:putative sterol carrier protein